MKSGHPSERFDNRGQTCADIGWSLKRPNWPWPGVMLLRANATFGCRGIIARLESLGADTTVAEQLELRFGDLLAQHRRHLAKLEGPTSPDVV